MSVSSRQFEMEIRLPATPDQVWSAIADKTELQRWFAPRCEIEPRVGGAVLWQWGEHHTWPQVVETCEPGAHLRTRYDSVVDDGAGGKRPLFIDFFLTGDGGETVLRLVHSGFGPEGDFDAEYDGISSGWPVELRSLRHYLAHHRGRDRQIAWSLWSTQLDPETAWSRLTGDGGLPLGGLHELAEGDSYSVSIPGAGSIAGRVLHVPHAREFSGTAENLNNGWFRVHCEHWAGATQIWIWLAAYDADPNELAKFERAFDTTLGALFDDGKKTAGAVA